MDTHGSDEQALEEEAGISTETRPISTVSTDLLVAEHIPSNSALGLALPA
jgi:hypothetical protein